MSDRCRGGGRQCDPAGQPQDRETILARYRSGAVRLTELSPADLDLRVLGNVGLVSGRTRLRGHAGSNEFDLNLRFFDVYRRNSDGWQLIASTVTPIPQAEKPLSKQCHPLG